ncbi:MAG TPA: ABC transporter permease [Streptosporangiaceae bacterium]|jgi:teichoic acid transport system permease protein|nr:ABC transporter permease [Streptosporangiaceae bacterium]
MSDRGQLSAPGSLQNSTGIARVRTPLPAEPLAKLAADNGLKPSAQRPGLIEYLGQLWQRRHFIVAYATARNVSMYTDARLGQVWQVLTPLLNCAVYYLIFGILFKAQRGVDHYIAFLVIGVFIFTFTERSLLVGSRVMYNNLSLIRALHFPRASLPLAYVIVELQQLLLSMFVMAVIVLGVGEPLTWYWFLVIPALLLQTLFNIGACLFIARIGAQLTDVSQLVPFLNRVWRYFCGVMYSIATLPTMLPFWSKAVLQFNPAAVYISLMRFALMQTQRTYAPGAQPYDAMKCARFNTTKNYLLQPYCRPEITTSELWLAGAGWAIFAIVVGLVYFWRAETRYGRG